MNRRGYVPCTNSRQKAEKKRECAFWFSQTRPKVKKKKRKRKETREHSMNHVQVQSKNKQQKKLGSCPE